MENIVTLEMQDNGLSQIKIIASNETSPEKVLHPQLGVGIQPTYAKFQEENCIRYNFEKGKFLIEVFEINSFISCIYYVTIYIWSKYRTML